MGKLKAELAMDLGWGCRSFSFSAVENLERVHFYSIRKDAVNLLPWVGNPFS